MNIRYTLMNVPSPSPHHDTSSIAVTVPRCSTVTKRINRRLYACYTVVRQRCTRILGTPEPRCTSLQKRRDALNLSNRHLVQSEVIVSCSNLLNNTETKTRSVIDYPGLVLFDGDGSDSAAKAEAAAVKSRCASLRTSACKR